jgi:hypothetical protein
MLTGGRQAAEGARNLSGMAPLGNRAARIHPQASLPASKPDRA